MPLLATDIIGFIVSTQGPPPFLPPICPTIELSQNGNPQILTSAISSMSPLQNNKNIYIEILLYFEILDALICSKISNYEDKTFNDKYISYRCSNTIEEIIKFMFGIFLIFRNKLIHDKKLINISDKDVEVHGTNKWLLSTIESMRIFCSIIYLIQKNDSAQLYASEYYRRYIVGLFNCALYNVAYHQPTIISPNINLDVNIFNRNIEIYKTNNFFEKNNFLYFNIDDVSQRKRHNNYRMDYMFEYNNKQYRLPEECLDSDRKILIQKLSQWENFYIHA